MRCFDNCSTGRQAADGPRGTESEDEIQEPSPRLRPGPGDGDLHHSRPDDHVSVRRGRWHVPPEEAHHSSHPCLAARPCIPQPDPRQEFS